MLISGIFGRKNIYSVDVDIEFPEEVFANRSVPAIIRVTNRSRLLPLFLIEVSTGEECVLFPYVEAGSCATRSFNVRYPGRGRRRSEGVEISSVFPFNFFRRRRYIKKEIEIIVLPEPIKCAWTSPRDRRNRHKGSEQSNIPGFDSDIISIRDYIPGDPVRYISWKSTAKTGRLKTRELSSIEDRHVIIDFDKADKRGLEYRISCATFVILNLMRSGIPVGLIMAGKKYKPGISNSHRMNMLKDLALYDQG